MQTAYIADLPFQQGGSATWENISALVDHWLITRIGVTFEQGETEHASADGRADARRRELTTHEATGPRLMRWDIRQTVPDNPGWQYLVAIWLSEERSLPGSLTMRCRLNVASRTGQVVQPSVPLGRPRVIHDVLRSHSVLVDGFRVGKGHEIGPEQVPGVVALLKDPRRLLPVLVMTPATGRTGPWCDPDKLASGLGGLAHVLVLTPRLATFALTDALGGTQLSVFGGALRLYWPSFSLADDRRRHPLWFESRLSRTQPAEFIDQLFGRLGRVSAIASSGVPALERRLLADQATERQEENASRMRALLAEVMARSERPSIEATSKSVLDDEAWVRDYEKALNDAEEAENEKQALALRVEELEDDLAAVRQALADIQMAAGRPGDMEGPAGNDDVPGSVLEAVQTAASSCQNLIFLPEAFNSATESRYPDPVRVLLDLRILDELAAKWRDDDLPRGFKAACADLGLAGYRDGIGQVAATKYEEDYLRTYGEQQVMLGPHIAHGTGAPASILRLYWYADTSSKAFVVGHVGRKLRDDSNG